jgi:hypothetical protein
MFHPETGVPFLTASFTYLVTSHGFRTAVAGEPAGPSQLLHFKNSSGGVMWSWPFNTARFPLQCGWHREYHIEYAAERLLVDWFALWRRVEHRVSGFFYYC